MADAVLLKSVPLRQPDHSASLERYDGNFQTHEVKRSIQIHGASENRKNELSAECHGYEGNRNDRRIRGRSWITSWGTSYGSAGSEMTSERQAGIFGRWVDRTIDQMTLVGRYNLTDSQGRRVQGSHIATRNFGSFIHRIWFQEFGDDFNYQHPPFPPSFDIVRITGNVTGEHAGRTSSGWFGCETSVDSE